MSGNGSLKHSVSAISVVVEAEADATEVAAEADAIEVAQGEGAAVCGAVR